MAFGLLYPQYKERRVYPLEQPNLYAAAKSAAEQLGWFYQVLWGKELQGRVPTTNWSWHHEFKVRFMPGGIVEVESHSAYTEILFDFGRNRRNVETFFGAFEPIVKATTPDKT